MVSSKSIRMAGSIPLVTGANRGIGRALVEGLLAAGATRVYAGARRVADLEPLRLKHGDRLIPLRLDVTSDGDVAAAAARANDVNLLFNNAGVAGMGTGLGDGDVERARQEMEVNYFGVLRMARAFAPVLRSRGGGAVVNIASIASMVNFPAFNTYCASKAAAWSLSIGLRSLLTGQNTRVVSVHPGPVDTDMAAGLEFDKASPADVVQAIIDGLASGADEIFPDAMARDLYRQWRADPKSVEAAAVAAEG
jgi:NAD(P)-dependent dehydrogenase (short-subunit alcohol dehydrogenase family)